MASLNPSKRSEYNKRWREANKEKISERNKKWREANKEKVSSYNKQWREENKERIAQRNLKYRIENNEILKERNRKWYKEHRDEQTKKMRDRFHNQTEQEREHWNKIQSTNKRMRKLVKRKFIRDSKIGKKCNTCGFICKDPATHDYHHVKGKKLMAIAQMSSNDYSLEAIKKEIKKCILLCRNCHAVTYKKSKDYLN